MICAKTTLLAKFGEFALVRGSLANDAYAIAHYMDYGFAKLMHLAR